MKLLINPLKLSDEELEQVADLAACNYPPERIALFLDVDRSEFLREWYNHESEVRINYNRGQLLSEFEINQKQLELAKSGNITAAQVFFKESERTKFDNLRNQCFFNE